VASREHNQTGNGFDVLVVDDEELYCRSVGEELARAGIDCRLAFSGSQALEEAAGRYFDVILLDHRLPDSDGIELIPRLLSRCPGASLVVMTAYHAIPNAVQAIRSGAEDYVVKEPSVRPLVERVLEVKRRQEVRRRSNQPPEAKPQALIGSSPAILRVVEQIEKIAASPDTTVLLMGETGVGKEVCARMLHRLSRPEGSPFVAVDCASLPGNLAESLLFGHQRGAFTGAEQDRAGAMEEAGEGTLLLDEIGELGALQSKLLRVLETRIFQRVGSMKPLALRARVVAATNMDLAAKVQTGQFRQDLYQRLCVFPITVPPLRERREDVLALANHFLSLFARRLERQIEPLDDEVAERLQAYHFPGNVRELKNIIERAVILAEDGRVETRHLPRRVLSQVATRPGPAESVPLDFRPGLDTLEDLERKMILHALRRSGGVKTEAARLLGISRFQLMRRMERHGIRQVVVTDTSGGSGRTFD